ncbi:MAG: ABC transporter ATP-binding protein/permease [Clostridium sp.]
MLELKDIKKDYVSGNETVHALKGISLSFRENEFVSILGQSGCGKTTMLNIIGGLDQYTSGDLIINGTSTKNYKARDWDTYRNHTIGFVFQSYNLIPHQNVLSNVELALTLSGVPKEERRRRAKEALIKVGLEDQMYKRPNQMSGGQMQRVAIARALVNNPDVLLADEPTGALDSETSVAIMELLKEVAKDKLVIMVTHNPELAEKYSTRIINLLDGNIVSDSNPVGLKEEIKQTSLSLKKTSMSFLTALSLSLNNLMTKKTRTFLTAFAGSIGIIGIALILSLSNGVQNYIDGVEKDTLSSYPITIEDNSMNMDVMMETMMGMGQNQKTYNDAKIHSRQMINDILKTMSEEMETNNMEAFKDYLDNDNTFREHAKAIEYAYNLSIQSYYQDDQGEWIRSNPNELMDKLGFSEVISARNSFMGSFTSMMPGNDVWQKLPSTTSMRDEQYEVVEGRWPTAYNEVVISVDKDNQINDFVLYSLGFMDQQELVDNYNAILNGEEVKEGKAQSYTVDELLNKKFKLLLNTDYYKKVNNIWMDMSEDEDYITDKVKDAQDINIVGIIKAKENTVSSSEMGGIYYTDELQEYVIDQSNNSEIVKDQKENKDVNVLTGTKFSDSKTLNMSNLSDEQKMALASLSQEELTQYMSAYSENANATYESNLEKFGAIDLDNPSSISIYANSFDDKEAIADLINAYNTKQEDAGNESNVISYNDIVGTMMESVTSIIDMISYVLMAFVSVSLIVSSIMIGIITYISVLERTKEIGILRSIGASKKDISRVFNAETFLIGLTSGLLGIGITVLLNIPISMIVEDLTGVANIASLPYAGGIILILISLILTVIAGLIPSRIASKKDPVEALRTE